MPRTYLDFDLLIERAETGYRARVLDSPSGQAEVEFALPFSALEMENFLLRITRSLGDMRRKLRRLESPEREMVRGFGSQLFGAVFSGTVQGALQSSLNEAYRRNSGLRVRLRLTDAPELADVPWEFLHNPASNQFLSLSPDTPLVRYLDLPLAARPLAVTPPIRVLVMISSPTDFPQLDVAAEWDRLESSLHDLIERGLVSVTRLPSGTLASLQRPLRLSQYHILHFVGHGGFDEQSQDGALVLEDAQGRGRLVSGQDLGVMLTGHRSLRLVILNACEGARSSSSDPFAGVAQTLIQQAIPAVIAMQFEITDEAAITFAREFYGAVADGYPVDAALAESRRAIFAQGNEVEWATPVLYMRSPNGQLFRLAPSSPEASKEAAQKAAAAEADQRAREELEAAAVLPIDVVGEAAAPHGLQLGRMLRARPAITVALPLLASLLLIVGIVLPFGHSFGEAKWIGSIHPAFVLGPLAAAALVAFVGLRAPRRRTPFLNGLLIASGIAMVLLFLAYSAPGDKLCGDFCDMTPDFGVFAGAVGGALTLAVGMIRERKSTEASLPWSPRMAAMIVLAVIGGLVLIIATVSSSLIADGSKTLVQDSPFALAPLAMAIIGLAAPMYLVSALLRRGFAPGLLAGAGLQAFLLFLAVGSYIGANNRVGAGVYLGLLSGALLMAAGFVGYRRTHRAGVGKMSSRSDLGIN